MRFRRDRSAGVVVFRREASRVLLLLLRSRLTRRPLWEFPKGGIDDGESTRDAALREVREETVLEAADLRFIEGFEHVEQYRFTVGRGDDRTLVQKEVIYYLAQTRRADITISDAEASEFAWVDERTAKSRIRYAERRRILESALEAIRRQAHD